MGKSCDVFIGTFDDSFDFIEIMETNFKAFTNQIKQGQTVLLKPNMFMLDKHFYTNLDLLLDVARFFSEVGARVIIAERLEVLYEIIDMKPQIRDYAEIQSFDTGPQEVIKIEGATSLRQEISIPKILLECDFLIGVPQFRTHAGVQMSNALKNMVGILPGFTTRVVHNIGLQEAVVDLNRIRELDFVVSDLITTIENNYPISGEPVHRNKVVIGNNAVAVDMVVAELAGFQSKEIEYLNLAIKEKMGPATLDSVKVNPSNYEHLKFKCKKAGVVNDAINDKIAMDTESACDECKRYCNGLYNYMVEELKSDEEYLIASGININQNKSKYSTENVILVGTCAYKDRDRGIYLEGCPPRAIQASAAVEWLNSSGRISERLGNQCRWPKRR